MKTTNDKKIFSRKRQMKSFSYAFSGLRVLFREEQNVRIHLLCAVLAVSLGFFLKISSVEWVAVVGSIGFVLALETINTAIEAICDHVTLEQHPQIKRIKDLAAAAVFISAIATLTIGLIIFLPKIIVLCCSA